MSCCPVNCERVCLTFPVLSGLAGTQETVLLALFDTIIARQKLGLLQNRLVLRVLLNQRAGNSMANGFGLAIEATTGNAHNRIEHRRTPHDGEGSHGFHGHRLDWKVDLDRLAIYDNLAGSRNEVNTRNSSLSLTRSPNLRGCHSILPS
jgi:hypothetical protein